MALLALLALVGCLTVAAYPAHEAIPPPEPCSSFCRMFYAFFDQDGDGYTTVEELTAYFDAFDSRLIGRRNVENIALLVMKWDTNHDEMVSYAEFAAAFPDLANVGLSMTPDEIHLSIVNDGNLMVMWVTKSETATSTVQFGTTFPANLSLTATGSTHTYTAGGWKGVIHQVSNHAVISWRALTLSEPRVRFCWPI